MAQNKKNLKPDVVLKNYWNDNIRFADFFNAVLFNGEQVIKPSELYNIDTENSFIMEHRNYAESIQASRDSIKMWKKYGIALVMYGQEGQEHIHYAIPMRIMGYDYGSYKKQYDANAAKYGKTDFDSEDEYLSRMKKTDKFIPVITVVVYYGSKPWDGATTLHEMLNIPKELESFVSDYKVLLVEARNGKLELHNKNNQHFFALLDYILNCERLSKEAKDKIIQYCNINDVDVSVIRAAAVATGAKIDYNTLKKGEDVMCTLFDEIEKEGMAMGEKRGKAMGIIIMGLEFGLSKDDILNILQTKLGVSLEVAQDYMNEYNQ